MLKRLETLRRPWVIMLNKPLTVKKATSKKASGKRPASPISVNGSDVEEEQEEGEEGEEETGGAAAAGKEDRRKIPKKMPEAAAAAAAAAAGGARPKMKWDTPASGNPLDATYEQFLDPSRKKFIEDHPEVAGRLKGEDQRLLITGAYREPEPIKVEEWHAAIEALFGFPVS